MKGTRVLVVDDEPALRRLLRTVLERHDCIVIEAGDARAALAAADIDKPAAIFLDLGLPDRDGLELVPLLASQAAVLVVSARDRAQEKIAALDLGAEDFITKPFDTEELMARLRTALRRRTGAAAGQAAAEFGEVRIDFEYRQVTKAGVAVHLTPKEYALLFELARHPGKVRTHGELLRAVWGPAHEHDLQYLRVAARGLRVKLEANPAAPRLIVNEPSIGYRLGITGG